VWYRYARGLTPGQLEREELEDIGGVREKDGVDGWAVPDEEPEPPAKPDPRRQQPPAPPAQPDPEGLQPQAPETEQQIEAPPAPAATMQPAPPVEMDPEEEQQEAASVERTMAIPDVLAGAGVTWPAHDRCRCKVRVMPGSMTPVWESSPNACDICKGYERKFNQYVQGRGIKVSA
jgi:hypothetical protein